MALRKGQDGLLITHSILNDFLPSKKDLGKNFVYSAPILRILIKILAQKLQISLDYDFKFNVGIREKMLNFKFVWQEFYSEVLYFHTIRRDWSKKISLIKERLPRFRIRYIINNLVPVICSKEGVCIEIPYSNQKNVQCLIFAFFKFALLDNVIVIKIIRGTINFESWWNFEHI